jgi:hypothetical protein
MAISVPATKTAVADYLETQYTHGALFTTAPSGATPGTEVTGGTPPYARKPLIWTNGAAGVTTASATFDVPACTVVGTGVYDALTGGNYKDGNTVSSVTFTGQDTVTVTFTNTVV